MNRYAIYIVLAITLSYASADNYIQNGTLECDPKISCERGSLGDLVVDPNDCRSYYVCVLNGTNIIVPSDEPVPCPSGQYFSYETNSCLLSEEICVNPCLQHECPSFCTINDYETIAYPNDCRRFFECTPYSGLVERVCPQETAYFNGEICSNDPYACCDICTPYCEMANIEIADPFDCHSYYLCREEGIIPTDEDRFTCEGGMYFDPKGRICVEQTTSPACYAICSPYLGTTMAPRK